MKFVEYDQHESRIPISKDENSYSAWGAEEHMKNELQKKKEITSVFFENSEGKSDKKSTDHCN